MTDIIIERGGYDFGAAVKKAKKRPEFYEETILLDVARKIIQEMDAQDISRTELARRLDVSSAYITKILCGHENLTIETLAKIAFALNRKWECLLVDISAALGPHCLADTERVTPKTFVGKVAENRSQYSVRKKSRR